METIYNICLVLFPLSGICGGYFHFILFMHFANKEPNWLYTTFIINICVTAFSGMYILYIYNLYL